MRRLVWVFLVVGALVLLPSTAHGAGGDPYRSSQWSLDRIGAEAAWRVGDGSGVTVAVIDSGVDLHHEDLAAQLVPGHDFVDGDDDPQDAYGHGTHVAGIVAAVAGNGKGIAGVAPGAEVMPIRVLDEHGSGSVENVVAGIRWATAHGAKVINLSLGEDTQALLGPSFSSALREAWAAGAIPVVAAGNEILASSGFSDEPAMVVTATTRDDTKPTYSSGVGQAQWGIAAPGGELPNLGADGAILSTYWTGAAPNEYAYLAGTSQAAPQVSGALAILLSTGRFTPTQAVQRLLHTAKDIGAPGRDTTFGAGRLDLAAATRDIPSPVTTGPAVVTPPAVRSQAASPTVTVTTSAPPLVPELAPATTASAPDTPAATRRPSVALPARPASEHHGDKTVPALVAAAVLVAVALPLRHDLLATLGWSRRSEVP